MHKKFNCYQLPLFKRYHKMFYRFLVNESSHRFPNFPVFPQSHLKIRLHFLDPQMFSSAFLACLTYHLNHLL